MFTAIRNASSRVSLQQAGDLRGKHGGMELIHRIGTALPETSEPLWRVFLTCARENPNATPKWLGRGLVANEMARALISMVARSMSSNQRLNVLGLAPPII